MKDELRPLLLVLSHLQLRRAPGLGGRSCASELGLGRFEVKVWAGSERGCRSDLPLPWSAVLQWWGISIWGHLQSCLWELAMKTATSVAVRPEI